MDGETNDGQWQGWLAEQAGRLLLYARQQTRCEADAEDVLQAALVESWQRHGGREPPPPPLVYATIRRRAIDLARSDDRRRKREEAGADGDPQWFAPELGAQDEREHVERAVKSLPDEQREVLSLKIWGGLTFAQIAEALDIPANTAASRYRYALAALRKRMEPPA